MFKAILIFSTCLILQLFPLTTFAQKGKAVFCSNSSSKCNNFVYRNAFVTTNYFSLAPTRTDPALFLNYFSQPNSSQFITKCNIPKGSVFCRMEDKLYKRFSVWIKIRAGSDDEYRKMILIDQSR